VDAHPIPKVVGHRRKCASPVASFAAGVAVCLRPRPALHTGALIATSASPVRCGTLADARRVVGVDRGRCVYIIAPRPVGRRRACASPVASFAAGVAVEALGVQLRLQRRGNGPTRFGRSRAGARPIACASHRRTHRHFPLRCARASQRVRRRAATGGDGRRVRTRNALSAVMKSHVTRQVTDERARPWSCRSPRAFAAGAQPIKLLVPAPAPPPFAALPARSVMRCIVAGDVRPRNASRQ